MDVINLCHLLPALSAVSHMESKNTAGHKRGAFLKETTKRPSSTMRVSTHVRVLRWRKITHQQGAVAGNPPSIPGISPRTVGWIREPEFV